MRLNVYILCALLCMLVRNAQTAGIYVNTTGLPSVDQYFLLDVKPNKGVKPSVFPKFFTGAPFARTPVKLPYAFQVTGENRVLLIVKSENQSTVDFSEMYDQASVKTIPLRPYEGFAENILGVEKAKILPPPIELPSDGITYWLRLKIRYKGLTTPQ